jgi:hypothetical protein
MQQPENETPPIFIVGMPRSGTTLLSAMLNAHGQVSISPETHYFGKYWRKCQRRNCLASRRKFEAYLDYCLNGEEIQNFGFTAQEIEDIKNVILSSSFSHRTILKTILSFYAARNGKTRYGEKTPTHIQYVQQILNLFPESQIVQIIRDPRDVVLSLREVPWGRGNIVDNLRQWKQCVSVIHRLEGLKGSYHELRYEDLLNRPDTTLQTLCRFLNIGFEDAMLEYNKHAKQNFNLTLEPWKAKAGEPIDISNQLKWKTDMSQLEQKLVVFYASTELDEKGYELGPSFSGLSDYLFCCYREVQNALLIIRHWIKRIYLRLIEYKSYV